MRQFYRTLLMLALPLVVAACNTDYNFDNISLEVTVGDTEGIVIPVGQTGPIKLSDLLKESGLETTENGYYGFGYSGSYEYTATLGTIPTISGLIPAIQPITNDFYGALDTSFPPFNMSEELSLPEQLAGMVEIPEWFPLIGQRVEMTYETRTFDTGYIITLPEQVAAVQEVHFGTDGEGVLLKLDVDLAGLASVTDNRTIEKLNVELPAGFTLEIVDDDPMADYITISASDDSPTPNHFTISNYPVESSTLAVEFIIKSLTMGHLEIGEDHALIIDESVSYDLSFSGNLKAGAIEGRPRVDLHSQLSISDALIFTNEIAHEIAFTEQISERIAIPEEIKRIDYVTVATASDAKSKPAISIDLGIEGSPLQTLELKDVELTLPTYLDIRVPDGWNYTSEGVLSIESLTLNNGEVTPLLDLLIYGLSFLPIENGQIVLDGTIGLKATAFIAKDSVATIDTSAEPLTITPIVTIDDIAISSVEGVVEADFGDLMEPVEITIGEFGEELEGLDMELNIASPNIEFAITNPIGVDIDAVIRIAAMKDGAEVATIASPTIRIPRAVWETPTTTRIHIVTEDAVIPDSADPNNQYHRVEGLMELIGSLPESIVVSLDAEVNQTLPSQLLLRDEYTFAVEYTVGADLCFSENKDGHIAYTTIVEDIDLTELASIEATVESITLNIHGTSTLPINLSVGVEPLDAEGNPIESIVATTNGSIEGSTTTEPTSSSTSVQLTITPAEGSTTFAEVAKINKLRCTFEGTTLAGGGLKPDQYVEASFSLLLDKGITVDLGAFLPDEPEDESPNEEGEKPENEENTPTEE